MRKGWGPEPRKMGPQGRPKFSRFSFPLPPQFSFFLPSLGGPAAPKPPGLHTKAREPKRAHLNAPAFKHHQNSTRRPPREGRKKENCGGRGTKERNCGRSWGGRSRGGQFWGMRVRERSGEGGPGEGRGGGTQAKISAKFFQPEGVITIVIMEELSSYNYYHN